MNSKIITSKSLSNQSNQSLQIYSKMINQNNQNVYIGLFGYLTIWDVTQDNQKLQKSYKKVTK